MLFHAQKIWKTPEQRRHFGTAFQAAYSTWGLTKRVYEYVYAVHDLILRSKDLIWPEENSLYKFGGGKVNDAMLSGPYLHTKE